MQTFLMFLMVIGIPASLPIGFIRHKLFGKNKGKTAVGDAIMDCWLGGIFTLMAIIGATAIFINY
jgi:hypothetical protein